MRKKMALTAVGLGALVSLAGAVFFDERINSVEGGSAPLSWSDPEESSDDTTAIILSPGQTLIIEGDSLIAGRAGGVEHGPDWPSLLRQALADRSGLDVYIINRGLGGATASKGAQRWRDTRCGDVALILYGANDAAVRGWLRGRKAVGLAQYRTALKQIIARYRACDARVGVIAPLPPASRAMSRRLAPYRKAAREVAQTQGVLFLDPGQALLSKDAPLQADGLHLSRAGRDALAEFFANQIEPAQ